MNFVRVEHQTQWRHEGKFYRCVTKWPDGSDCGTVHTVRGFGPFGGWCVRMFDVDALPDMQYGTDNIMRTILIPGTNRIRVLRFPGWKPIGAGARVYDDGLDPSWADDHRSQFVD